MMIDVVDLISQNTRLHLQLMTKIVTNYGGTKHVIGRKCWTIE